MHAPSGLAERQSTECLATPREEYGHDENQWTCIEIFGEEALEEGESGEIGGPNHGGASPFSLAPGGCDGKRSVEGGCAAG